MNNKLIKETAQEALYQEYGFKPPLKEITLLEADGDRTYIRFRVKKHVYEFESYTLYDGSVWVGSGTIEKRS